MATAIVKRTNNGKIKKAKAVSYGVINIKQSAPTVKIKEVLPFRVRFTTITVPGYSANNVAPIGIAVIGYSNYIL